MRRSILLIATLAASMLFDGRQTFAEFETNTWPQFRGPQANSIGASANLPATWSLTENVEWQSEIPGRGWSSPIVWGDRIFITTVIAEKESKPAQPGTEYSNEYAEELSKQGLGEEEIMQKLRERDFEMPEEVSLDYMLYCLDLNDGKVVWTTSFHKGKPPFGRHRKNSFASETPTTDGQMVYVYVGNLGVFAFDYSGNPVWKKSFDPRAIYLDFGSGSSPILVDDKLVVLNDNEEASQLLALDKLTGEILWDIPRGKFSDDERPMQASGWTTPLMWKNSQRSEIVTIGPGRVTSYDLDGNELWWLKGNRAGPAASPIAVGDQLLVNCGSRAPLYSIRPGASGDITPASGEQLGEFIAWSYPRSVAYIPTPLAYEGGLYILGDSGVLVRLSLETGKESYKTRVKGGTNFTTSPWAYNHKVFLASEQGEIFVLEGGEEFKQLHVNQTGEMAMASPAIVGDRLLLRTEQRILSIRGTQASAFKPT